MTITYRDQIPRDLTPAEVDANFRDLESGAGITALDASKVLTTQAGSGAVERDVEARLQDFVSVLDFIPVSEHAAIIARTSTTDLTLYIQAALDAHYGVFFPDGVYTINIDRVTDSLSYAYGLSAANNQRIWLAKNAELRANLSAINWGAIIAVFDKTDVEIIGGKWKGDRALEADTTTELFRHNIDIRGSSRVTLRDVYSYNSRGDNFYIGAGPVTTTASDHVSFYNCTGFEAHRNNLSIVKCDHFLDYGGLYEGADGVNPKAGVDVESDGTDEHSDIAFFGTRFINNGGTGLEVAQRAHNVQAFGCHSTGNAYGCRVAVVSGTVEADLTWIGGSLTNNTNYNAGVDGDYTILTVDGATISGTVAEAESQVKINGLAGANRRVTVRNCTIKCSTALTGIVGWSHSDVTGTYRFDNNDIFVSAAVNTSTLRGVSMAFRGNRIFALTGYANTNNGSILITNVPFTSYSDCQFWNDTTNSYRIGAQTALARRVNCTFDQDTEFRGYLSDAQLAKDLTGNATTVGTGEDDLKSYTIPADSLGRDGGIHIFATGSKTGAGGNKTLKLYVDGVARTFHAAANNTNSWELEAWITMNDNTNVMRIAYKGYDGTTLVRVSDDLEGVDGTADVIVKITGECANGADAISVNQWIVSQI